jgi:hypothetical protein
MIRFGVLTIFVLLLLGCSSIPGKMNKLTPGMPESEAVNILGEPDTTSANSKYKYLFYTVTTSFGVQDTFYVITDNGYVDSFGQMPRQQINPAAAAAILNNMNRPPAAAQPVYQMPLNKPMNVNCTSNQLGSTTYTNCH